MRDCSTDLSLWMALLGLEHNVVMRAESEMATFTFERRQVSTALTLGTTRPFQVKPDSKSNARTELGTNLAEFAGISVTGLPASGILRWNRRERRIRISVDSLKAGRSIN